jgi:hypothetical protein
MVQGTYDRAYNATEDQFPPLEQGYLSWQNGAHCTPSGKFKTPGFLVITHKMLHLLLHVTHTNF